MTVTCFRALAKNVDECVRKGDRLIVHGRARVKDYVAEGGAQRTAVDVEADGVGHNLMFGTARFRPAKTAENVEDQIRAQADELMRELADQPREDVETLIAQRAARNDEPDEYDRTDDPDESLDEDLDEDLDEELDEESDQERGGADELVDDDAADEDPHRSPDDAPGLGRKPRASRRKVLAGLTG